MSAAGRDFAEKSNKLVGLRDAASDGGTRANAFLEGFEGTVQIRSTSPCKPAGCETGERGKKASEIRTRFSIAPLKERRACG